VALRFQRLTEANLPMLTQWLKRPHVAAWSESFETVAEVRGHLPGVADSSTVLYIVCLDNLPIGYIQSYVAADSWPGEHDPTRHPLVFCSQHQKHKLDRMSH
jgi:hypothetical protein